MTDCRLRFPNRNLLGSRSGGLSVAPTEAGGGLDPLLAEAVVLLRASQFDGVDGDDWVNEGTGGPDYDAAAFGEDENHDPYPPQFVTSPEPGFVTGVPPEQVGVITPPHYEVPPGAAIDITTGSFTVAWRGLWTDTAEGTFDPLVAKVTGNPGVDGHGWMLLDGSAASGAASLIANGAAVAFAARGSALSAAEHLVVMSVDRGTNLLSFYVDGVAVTPADASAVTSAHSINPIVIGRTTGRNQTVRDIVLWDRALTDAEITVDLPAALEA